MACFLQSQSNAVQGSKKVEKAHREKLCENRVGSLRETGIGACKHFFQYIISVYQLLVYPVIGQF